MDLIVLAKEPVPGQVKTRLTPPCTPDQAATIAAAALSDTLSAALATGADRVIVALDGAVGPWCPPGAIVVPQGSGTLADRLTAAWRATAGPALQIGMDTPQLGPAALDQAMAHLVEGPCDAVLGLAEDGGWWAIGLVEPNPGVFVGIPTSAADTGALQMSRLEALGLRMTLLPMECDVDTWADALAVAAMAPETAFSAAVRAVAVTS